MEQVTVTVHRHHVLTRVRFNRGKNEYMEYCVADPTCARRLYGPTPTNLWAISNEDTEGMPTFPYPAYLSITTEIDSADRVNVREAKFSDNVSGVRHFEDVFEGQPDLTKNVLENIVRRIIDKDAEALLRIIDGLTKVSRHKAVKE